MRVQIWVISAAAFACATVTPALAIERYATQLDRSAASLMQAMAEKDMMTIRREGGRLSRIVGALSGAGKAKTNCLAPANALYVLTIDLQSSEPAIVSAAKNRFVKFKATMPACRESDERGEDAAKPAGQGV